MSARSAAMAVFTLVVLACVSVQPWLAGARAGDGLHAAGAVAGWTPGQSETLPPPVAPAVLQPFVAPDFLTLLDQVDAVLMGSAPEGRELAPGETARVLTVEQWRVIHAMFPGQEYTFARIGMCESGLDPARVGAAGEQGAFQVMARYWGPVPADLAGQARQAARIAGEYGTKPWTTAGGCPLWNAERTAG